MAYSSRVRDYLIYLAVSVLALASVFISISFGVSKDSFLRWCAFVMFSLFLYGQFIVSSRTYWKRPAFWIWTGIAALLHTVIFLTVIRSNTQIVSWNWVLWVLIELGVLLGIRNVVSRAKNTIR